MPAILRNSLPNLLPSICNIGSYASIDRVGVRTTRSPPCHMVGESRPLQHYAMRSVSAVDRPSGPPACGSTVSNISGVISTVLSRFFGSFGLVVADGNSW